MKTYTSHNRTVILLLFLMVASVPVLSQRRESWERLKEERIKYFNEKLSLSGSEAEKFWPLYDDLMNRSMKINEEERTLLTYYSSNAEAMSDDEVNETITKYQALQDRRHKLFSEYHNKFVDVIGKRKTMRMYSLEREFRIYILEKFRSGEHGPGGPPPEGGKNK